MFHDTKGSYKRIKCIVCHILIDKNGNLCEHWTFVIYAAGAASHLQMSPLIFHEFDWQFHPSPPEVLVTRTPGVIWPLDWSSVLSYFLTVYALYVHKVLHCLFLTFWAVIARVWFSDSDTGSLSHESPLHEVKFQHVAWKSLKYDNHASLRL